MKDFGGEKEIDGKEGLLKERIKKKLREEWKGSRG